MKNIFVKNTNRGSKIHSSGLHPFRMELSKGNATEWIRDKALPYLDGNGLDIGCFNWKIKEDAIGVDIVQAAEVDLIVSDWSKIPSNKYDYAFSSHCLEHTLDWKDTLRSWIRVIKPEGVIFIYLPYAKAYNRWSKKAMPNHHKHDFDLPMIESELIDIGVKITDSGYDDHASFWIVGTKSFSS